MDRFVYVISYDCLRKHVFNVAGDRQPAPGPYALTGHFSKEAAFELPCKLIKKGDDGVFFLPSILPKTHPAPNGASSLSWNPSQSAESLAKQLLAGGPSLVRGAFGPKAYLDAPIEVIDDFAQEKVWAWKVGAKRAENLSVVYGVYLIGVKILKDKAQVFLFDAADLGSRKIYKISFENLQKHIHMDGRVTC
ncbi:MAG: hypothetical protein KDK62_08350 [Chlamydiia bacterium]|nr:hypothetical protein [Chlamydiia bacterium]